MKSLQYTLGQKMKISLSFIHTARLKVMAMYLIMLLFSAETFSQGSNDICSTKIDKKPEQRLRLNIDISPNPDSIPIGHPIFFEITQTPPGPLEIEKVQWCFFSKAIVQDYKKSATGSRGPSEWNPNNPANQGKSVYAYAVQPGQFRVRAYVYLTGGLAIGLSDFFNVSAPRESVLKSKIEQEPTLVGMEQEGSIGFGLSTGISFESEIICDHPGELAFLQTKKEYHKMRIASGEWFMTSGIGRVTLDVNPDYINWTSPYFSQIMTDTVYNCEENKKIELRTADYPTVPFWDTTDVVIVGEPNDTPEALAKFYMHVIFKPADITQAEKAPIWVAIQRLDWGFNAHAYWDYQSEIWVLSKGRIDTPSETSADNAPENSMLYGKVQDFIYQNMEQPSWGPARHSNLAAKWLSMGFETEAKRNETIPLTGPVIPTPSKVKAPNYIQVQ